MSRLVCSANHSNRDPWRNRRLLYCAHMLQARGAFLNGIGAGVAMGGVWLVQSRECSHSTRAAIDPFRQFTWALHLCLFALLFVVGILTVYPPSHLFLFFLRLAMVCRNADAFDWCGRQDICCGWNGECVSVPTLFTSFLLV